MPFRLPSRALERPVHVWQFGHYGAPVLVFPSASGMAHEWDGQGMVDALGDHLEQGRLKLYCVESNVAEAWTRREGNPVWRIGRHQAYERFVMDELVPAIRADCRTPDIRLAVTGCSLGGYYAANFALKYPEVFREALCLSARYDVTDFTEGLESQDVYFNNPMAYVPNLAGDALERVRRATHLTLVCGRGRYEDGNHQETARFAGVLGSKGIPHHLDLWGEDVSHEWIWWRRQVRLHAPRSLLG